MDIRVHSVFQYRGLVAVHAAAERQVSPLRPQRARIRSRCEIRGGRVWRDVFSSAEVWRRERGSRYPEHMSTSLPPYVDPRTMDVLFSTEQIAERVKAIGEQISEDYNGHTVVLIGVLKGAAIFLADLARAIKVDNTFDFVAVSSYGRARVSSGAVKLIKDIDNPIEGKHVILVEDILDTGLTLSYLRGLMLQHKPAIAEDRDLPG